MVISHGMLAVPRNRFLEFRSDPFRGRESNSKFRSMNQKQKQTLGILFRTLQRKSNKMDSVLWNRNRSKLSEFPPEPFSGRENNSEFRSVEQNTAPSVSDSIQMRVLVEAIRLGRDVAECG
jgi:hypothetical protein